MKTGPLYHKMLHCKADTIVNQGGSSSSKTYSTMQVLLTWITSAAQKFPHPFTIVAADVPKLKRGALSDFYAILESSPAIASRLAEFNKTDRIATFANGSVMQFISLKDAQAAKTGKHSCLFVNEADGISYDVYKQLAIRCYGQIYIDYNPSARFWVHEKLLHKQGTQLFITDHRHNPFLPQKIHEELESLRYEDDNLFRVYARGLTGVIAGVVLPNCRKVESVPEGAKLIGRGLDFGYVNDPTAVYELYQHQGELYANELIYQKGLKNPQIAKMLIDLGITGKDEIIADSAEKKSIDEINDFGLWLTPVVKGPDSIKFGIDILSRFRINITENSGGLLYEQPKYVYLTDKEGNRTNQPIDRYNHAIDSLRYIAMHKLGHIIEKKPYAFASPK